MVYLFKMVIFHGQLLNNQMVPQTWRKGTSETIYCCQSTGFLLELAYCSLLCEVALWDHLDIGIGDEHPWGLASHIFPGKPFLYAGFEPFHRQKTTSFSKHVLLLFFIPRLICWHVLTCIDMCWHMCTYTDLFGQLWITMLGNTTRNKNKHVRKKCPYPLPWIVEWSQEGSKYHVVLLHPPSHQNNEHDVFVSLKPTTP